jgi:hypothetical protein
VDSLPVEIHGQQYGSKWNGDYHWRMYQPLMDVLNPLLSSAIRPRNRNDGPATEQ